MTSFSVVIPVKDGERYLEELLAAVASQPHNPEVLVVDSGSRDRSVEIARAAGVTVLEIPPEDFGHGKTRNLAAENTSGELVCFLTQDATPIDGWLDAYARAFSLDERVGAAFGPHLARKETSPMIARELEEFFSSFSPNGEPTIQRSGDEPFLSNVNACYRRTCWEEIRFRDISYAEDQAFGRDLLAAGWVKVYHPSAAVLHAHDYGPLEFMRRYFDEYRGLRDSAGHIEPIRPRGWLGDARRETAADRDWMAERSFTRRERTYWTARAALHHGSRRVFSALGSRSDRLPKWTQSRLSLEAREDSVAASEDHLATCTVAPTLERARYSQSLNILRTGAGTLSARPSPDGPLNLLFVVEEEDSAKAVPETLRELTAGLSKLGHTIRTTSGSRAHGAVDRSTDVVLSTGWSSALAANQLQGSFARGCLLTDYEPALYPSSSQSVLSDLAYRTTARFIVTNRWTQAQLAQLGLESDLVVPGVDHTVFSPSSNSTRRPQVICYAPSDTGEHAAALAGFALEELHAQAPTAEICVFGSGKKLRLNFPYTHFGDAPPKELLVDHYRTASIGIALSLTSPANELVEMLACGLPVVDLNCGGSDIEARDCAAIRVAEPEPKTIASAALEVMGDQRLRTELGTVALSYASRFDWTVTTTHLVDTLQTWFNADPIGVGE